MLDITNFQYVCNFRSSNSVGILTDLFCLLDTSSQEHHSLLIPSTHNLINGCSCHCIAQCCMGFVTINS